MQERGQIKRPHERTATIKIKVLLQKTDVVEKAGLNGETGKKRAHKKNPQVEREGGRGARSLRGEKKTRRGPSADFGLAAYNLGG